LLYELIGMIAHQTNVIDHTIQALDRPLFGDGLEHFRQLFVGQFFERHPEAIKPNRPLPET
jgi:hypothetical protein